MDNRPENGSPLVVVRGSILGVRGPVSIYGPSKLRVLTSSLTKILKVRRAGPPLGTEI
jgi:hypothetical protein